MTAILAGIFLLLQILSQVLLTAIVTNHKKIEHLVNPGQRGYMYTGIYRPTDKSSWTRVDTGETIEYYLPWTYVYRWFGYNCLVLWNNFDERLRSFSNNLCNIPQPFVCELPLIEVECNCKLPCNYVEYPEDNTAYKIHREKLKRNASFLLRLY